MSDIPKDIRPKTVVVNPINWKEIILFLEGKKTTQYLFFVNDTPLDNFLKVFEDYVGDLVCYSVPTPTPVVLSRFTKVSYRITPKYVDLCPENKLEQTLSDVKKVLNDY